MGEDSSCTDIHSELLGATRAGIIIWVSGDRKSKHDGGYLRNLKMKGYVLLNQGASKVFSGIKWLSFKSSW